MNNFWITDMPKYSMIIFIVLNIISMILYPGGNLHDFEQVGYSFTRNFFSDLGLYESWSGDSNIISSILFSYSLFFVTLMQGWPSSRRRPRSSGRRAR